MLWCLAVKKIVDRMRRELESYQKVELGDIINRSESAIENVIQEIDVLGLKSRMGRVRQLLLRLGCGNMQQVCGRD
jgi:hypothetical protein